MTYTYYVDTDDSIICPSCYEQDPCEATKHIAEEAEQCSRCDEDVKAEGENTADYPESLEEIYEQEQAMQALDQAWGKLVESDIDPRNQEEDEEFGKPNIAYCNSLEPDHNGGWFCFHPDCVTSPCEDERIESRTWEWEERRYEAERLAYCGFEEF